MHNNADKNKLKSKCSKVVKTGIIGCLAILEKELEKELEDPDFEDKFLDIRDKMLDLCTIQIEFLDTVFKHYNVSSDLNTYNFYKGKG